MGWAEYGYLPGQSFCFCRWTTSPSYTLFMILICFGGPCSTMTFCYVNILREVRRSKKRIERAQQQSSRVTSPVPATPSHSTDGRSYSQTALTESTSPANTPRDVTDTPKNGKRMDKFRALFSVSDSASRKDAKAIKYTVSDIDSLATSPDKASVISNSYASAAAKKRREKRRREELRLTTSLFVVIVIFTICWFPFCITMFINVFGTEPVPRIPDITTMLLGCLNSCCNPIIYGVMNRKFRSGFAKLYCGLCRIIRTRKALSSHGQTSSSFPRSTSSDP